MADLPNARIPELPLAAALKAGQMLVLWNPENDLTEKFDITNVLTSDEDNFEWLSDTPYSDLSAVTWKGEWYQADGDVDENLIPGIDPAWVLISKSASGFVFWKAGVYPQTDVFVLKKMSVDPDAPDIRMFWLKDLTRPFISSNFTTELAAGKWVQAFVSATTTAGSAIKDMGDYNASTNLLPDTGTAVGSGVVGAISKGDEFTFSEAGTIGGELYPAGTIARAKISGPGQTLANWRLY